MKEFVVLLDEVNVGEEFSVVVAHNVQQVDVLELRVVPVDPDEVGVERHLVLEEVSVGVLPDQVSQLLP